MPRALPIIISNTISYFQTWQIDLFILDSQLHIQKVGIRPILRSWETCFIKIRLLHSTSLNYPAEKKQQNIINTHNEQ